MVRRVPAEYLHLRTAALLVSHQSSPLFFHPISPPTTTRQTLTPNNNRNTGFLRYWVPGNIPLFLLAAPMLTILVKSGFDQLLTSSPSPSSPKDDQKKKPSSSSSHSSPSPYKTLLNATATAQILLAVLAFTSYHVQIISRISSGYPFWYLWLAGKLLNRQKAIAGFSGNAIVMFTVIYASIQGALFTSFLPPA